MDEIGIINGRPFCNLLKFSIFIVIVLLLLIVQSAVADTPVQLLEKNKVAQLEAKLSKIQSLFEQGKLTEIELRNTYRSFYHLNSNEAVNLTNWAKSSPKSYVAHLAYGVYLKRRGMDARGVNSIGNTSRTQIALMDSFYKQSRKELLKSLTLTSKPYLSMFHLLNINAQYGDHNASLELLRKANKMLPINSLFRNQYAKFITPRWGGSYKQMEKLIADTKAEGVPQRVILQLEAIVHDDKGLTYFNQRKIMPALKECHKALELGSKVSRDFVDSYLMASRDIGCPNFTDLEICKK